MSVNPPFQYAVLHRVPASMESLQGIVLYGARRVCGLEGESYY